MIPDKPLILLTALLQGRTIVINQHKYRLFKPREVIPMIHGEGECPHYWLGFELESPQGKYVGAGITLIDFIEAADKLSYDETFVMAAETVLNRERVKKLPDDSQTDEIASYHTH